MLSNLKAYYRPKSIPQALALLEKNSGSILVIAGGTKLVPSQNNVVQELVDITSLNLNYIKEDSGVIRIGATTPIQKMVVDPVLNRPALQILSQAAYLTHFSKMIRNVSTIGGELATTKPLSVLYCALLALQAQVRIIGGDEFALAMNIFLNKKPLAGLIIEIIVPELEPQTYTALTSVQHEDTTPLIAVCTRVTMEKGYCKSAKIGITGTAKVPQRFHEIEEELEGKKFADEHISKVSAKAYDIYKPISDRIASEEYRKEASRFLLKKALTQCKENAEEDIE